MDQQYLYPCPYHVNLDGFMRIISYLVYEWGTKHPSVESMKKDELLKGFSKEEAYYNDEHQIPSSALPIIHFEKLVTFVQRFWQELFVEDLKDSEKPLKRKFIHGLGFGKIGDAKHGPRVQLIPTAEFKDSRKDPRYFNQIFYLLQEEGISKYLKVTPNKSGTKLAHARKFLEYDLSEVEDHLAYVNYSSNINSAGYFKGFTEAETDFIYKFLTPLVCKLTKLEIRALGTHWSKKNTIKAIQKEYTDIVGFIIDVYGVKEDSILDDLINEFESQNNFYEKANRILGYLDEAHRKVATDKNKKLYTSAYNKAKESLSHDERFLKTFNRKFEPPESIWNNQEITELEKRTEEFYSLLCIVTAIGYFQNSANIPNLRNKKRADYLYNDNVGFFGSSLPHDIIDVYESTHTEVRKIKDSYRSFLLEKLKSLKKFALELKETKS